MQQAYVIRVDTREKKPFVFPSTIQVAREWWPGQSCRLERVRLEVVSSKLDAGDYALLGVEGATIIERKYSISELGTNLFTSDRDRLWRALNRLKEACQNPIMVLDGGMEKYMSSPNVDWPYQAVLDETQRICLKLGIRLQVLPGSTARQRRIAGEWVARTLINGAIVSGESSVTTPIQQGLEVRLSKPGLPCVK